MSTPIYNGGLVGAIDDQGAPYIADDGNWSLQGNPPGEGPAYRALAMYGNGRMVFGYLPAQQREPFGDALNRSGVCSRESLLAWRGPVLAETSRVEMIVTGGNRYTGWGDTAGEDWMEWGSLDPVTLQPVIATTGVLVVPGDAPDPPDVIAQMRTMVDNVGLEMSMMTAHSFGAWKAANPKEFAAVGDYIGQWVFGGDPEPPILRTHAGRAMAGIAANGVLAQEKL